MARSFAQQLAQHSAAIDATSLSVFAQGFQQVAAEAKADTAQLHASARNNAAFKRVAAPLRPLARFLTTNANTCKKTDSPFQTVKYPPGAMFVDAALFTWRSRTARLPASRSARLRARARGSSGAGSGSDQVEPRRSGLPRIDGSAGHA